MIVYTADELLSILAEPQHHRDVIEVNYYVIEQKGCYAAEELVTLLEAINYLHDIFINSI